MSDLHRHNLMILGLGLTTAALSTLPVSAAPLSTHGQLPVASYTTDTDQQTRLKAFERNAPWLSGAPPALFIAQGSNSRVTNSPGLTLEPGEDPLPLEMDSSPTQPPGEGGLPLPAAQGPRDQGFETPPDYLLPGSNPLAVPTQPQEVQILGTQPISLATAIELAYHHNEELRIALLQLERVQAGLRAEQAALLPTVDLTADVQNTNQTSLGLARDESFTTLRGAVRSDYDLGLSGERSARLQTAQQQVRLAELRVEQTREELRLNTINDYYAVQQAIADIRINQAFLDEAQRNLRDTQLREEVGVGTRFDVLRADVQVANARQTLTQAISQRQITQRQLARRLNISPTVDLTTLAVEIAGTWPLSLEETILQAYQNRAELEQFLVERDLNQAQRQLQLTATRPNLSLFAQYELQSLLDAPAGSQNNTDDGFALGARLAWRLFDGGAASARASQSDRDIAIDEAEFESARNTIRVQVEEAYYTLQANQANITTANLAVKQATEALDLANLRFNAGVGTQLDVLSANRELTQAQGNLVRAVLDYNRALARLERFVSNLGQAG
ncbi:MAG: TolC family protein [Cyanobacteriota bacterium]|nr:TolC family protein [Cyanobacteriota bacterium]